MTPKRESLWEKKRSDWYRDAARTEIAEETSYFSFLFAFGSLALLAHGLSQFSQPEGWAALAGAVALIVSWRGLRTGKEWARWLAGLISIAFGLGLLARVLFVTDGAGLLLLGWDGAFAVLWSGTAYYLLGPGGRERFERARVGVPDED